MHLAVGRMSTEEADISTLCMPLPSAGLVGAGSSPGSGQGIASAVGTTPAGGESHASPPAATGAVQWCDAGRIYEMADGGRAGRKLRHHSACPPALSWAQMILRSTSSESLMPVPAWLNL